MTTYIAYCLVLRGSLYPSKVHIEVNADLPVGSDHTFGDSTFRVIQCSPKTGLITEIPEVGGEPMGSFHPPEPTKPAFDGLTKGEYFARKTARQNATKVKGK